MRNMEKVVRIGGKYTPLDTRRDQLMSVTPGENGRYSEIHIAHLPDGSKCAYSCHWSPDPKGEHVVATLYVGGKEAGTAVEGIGDE